MHDSSSGEIVRGAILSRVLLNLCDNSVVDKVGKGGIGSLKLGNPLVPVENRAVTAFRLNTIGAHFITAHAVDHDSVNRGNKVLMMSDSTAKQKVLRSIIPIRSISLVHNSAFGTDVETVFFHELGAVAVAA